tara:strand:- start:400 stop:987 length:588 start_codon:yes stop_codon:yes gene_type:complete
MIKGYTGSGTKYWTIGCPNIASMANGASKILFLDTDNAVMNDTSIWGNVSLTDSIVTINSGQQVNHVNSDYMFYAFKNIQGYSKVGQYVGNGSDNGPFVYTGFKPAFLMMKRTDSSGNWVMFDNTRDTGNVTKHRLFPNLTNADNTTRNYIDLLSNGFKMRNTDVDHNADGSTIMYLAFAESPFVTSTGVPATAR